MTQGRRIAALGGVAVLAAGAAVWLLGGGDGGNRSETATTPIAESAPEPAAALEALVPLLAVRDVFLPGTYVPGLDGLPPPRADGRYRRGGYALAYVRKGARVPVHSAPGGARVGRIGSRTEFGSPQVLNIVRRSGGWLGVATPAVRGGLGWVPLDPRTVELGFTRYTVHASLGQRRLEVRLGDRVVERFAVTIGRAGSETPPGRFAVTDALAGNRLGPWYGCCILALSGHQANLPAGWLGGDRIGIHGTPGAVGEALSAGCLRARNLNMAQLFARVPLGAPVFITA